MFEPTYGDYCKISGNGITFYTKKVRYDDDTEQITDDEFKTFNSNFAGLCDTEDKEIKKPEPKKPRNRVELISRKTKSQMSNSIYALLWLSGCKKMFLDRCHENADKKLTFTTLTLPSEQIHPDTFIKAKILNQFYTELRSTFTDLLYIWRSEKQMNGNIHIHTILNHYYNCNTLQNQWNRLVEKYGYVSRYADKFSKFSFDEYKQYVLNTRSVPHDILWKRYQSGKKNNWRNPPSTQITKINKVTNVSGYLCKEMTKENQCVNNDLSNISWSFPLSGRVFGCSQKLTEKSAFHGEIPHECHAELLSLHYTFPDKAIQSEFLTHMCISPDMFLRYKLPKLHRFYQNFIFS